MSITTTQVLGKAPSSLEPSVSYLMREAGRLRQQRRALREEFETVDRELSARCLLADWLVRAHDAGHDLVRLTLALECVTFARVHSGQTISDLTPYLDALATDGKFGACYGGRGGCVACVWALEERATDAEVDACIYLLTLLRSRALPWPGEWQNPLGETVDHAASCPAALLETDDCNCRATAREAKGAQG